MEAPTLTTTLTGPDAVIVPMELTIFTEGQATTVNTSVLSEVTASVTVTTVSTDDQGNTVTIWDIRPAIIGTTTDVNGRTIVTTSAGEFALTMGQLVTRTNNDGSTFVTTFTPGGGLVSMLKLITTTDEQGRPSTMTSYTFVDPVLATATSSSVLAPTSTMPPSDRSPSTDLAIGAKVGIGVGVALGVIIISASAFWMGSKARRKRTDNEISDTAPEGGRVEHKAELHGQSREAKELDGRGILRWWSGRQQRRTEARALNATAPQELPVGDPKSSIAAHELPT